MTALECTSPAQGGAEPPILLTKSKPAVYLQEQVLPTDTTVPSLSTTVQTAPAPLPDVDLKSRVLSGKRRLGLPPHLSLLEDCPKAPEVHEAHNEPEPFPLRTDNPQARTRKPLSDTAPGRWTKEEHGRFLEGKRGREMCSIGEIWTGLEEGRATRADAYRDSNSQSRTEIFPQVVQGRRL